MRTDVNDSNEVGELVVVTRHGSVGLIEFNDPEHLNPLEPKTSEAATMAALLELQADLDIRVVVLTGRGRSFSAGAYLGPPRLPRNEQDRERTLAQRVAYGYSFGDFWRTLHDYKKPLVAAVNGYALGGGWKVAFLCDMIIAGESATLGSAELDLGLTPSPITAHYLPKMLGKHRAFEVFAFSHRFTAREALDLGLVNRVVPDDECLEVALELARQLAERPPLALALTKQLMSKAFALDDDYELERSLASFLRTLDETVEVMQHVKDRVTEKSTP
jgi:enoyl-CoA hydratase